MFERKTQQSYDLKNFKFYPITDVYKIDTTASRWGPGTSNNALNDFKTLIPPKFDYTIFQYNDGATSLTGEFSYEQRSYTLSFKLIPTRPGLYSLRHSSQLVSLKANEVQDFPGRCSDKHVEGYTVLNNNSDNSRDLLLDSPDTLWSKIAYSNPIDYEKFGGYTFYVVE